MQMIMQDEKMIELMIDCYDILFPAVAQNPFYVIPLDHFPKIHAIFIKHDGRIPPDLLTSYRLKRELDDTTHRLLQTPYHHLYELARGMIEQNRFLSDAGKSDRINPVIKLFVNRIIHPYAQCLLGILKMLIQEGSADSVWRAHLILGDSVLLLRRFGQDETLYTLFKFVFSKTACYAGSKPPLNQTVKELIDRFPKETLLVEFIKEAHISRLNTETLSLLPLHVYGVDLLAYARDLIKDTSEIEKPLGMKLHLLFLDVLLDLNTDQYAAELPSLADYILPYFTYLKNHGVFTKHPESFLEAIEIVLNKAITEKTTEVVRQRFSKILYDSFDLFQAQPLIYERLITLSHAWEDKIGE
jgi:hypothetical protein